MENILTLLLALAVSIGCGVSATDYLYKMYPGDYWKWTNLVRSLGIWIFLGITCWRAIMLIGPQSNDGIVVAYFGLLLVITIINVWCFLFRATPTPYQALIRVYPDNARVLRDGSVAVHKIIVLKWGADFPFDDLKSQLGNKKPIVIQTSGGVFGYNRDLLIQQEERDSSWFHLVSCPKCYAATLG